MGKQFICPLPVSLSRLACQMPCRLAATNQRFTRPSSFPKISLPHSKKVAPQRRKCFPLCMGVSKLLPTHRKSPLSRSLIHCQQQPISIHITLSSTFLHFPPHFYPLLLPADPHTTARTLASLVFLKLACCVQSQYPLVAT